MHKKTSISDEKVNEILIDGINSGANYILNKSNFYEHIRTIHKIEKQRCLKLYDLYYSQAQIEKNNKKIEIGIEMEKEAVKTQIITREKFIESLESEIFDIEKIIKKGYILKDLTIEGKKERVKEFFKTYELAQWHKILNDKRDRLAKIQGFDAPIEQNTTVTIKDKPKVEDWILSKSNKIG